MPKDERKAISDNITEGDLLQVEGVMSQGYGIMPKVVMRDRRLTVDAKAIYAYMVSFAGAGQTAFPKRATILADLCMSKTSFYKHFQLLLEHDYIRIKRQKRGNLLGRNIYTLVMTPRLVEVKPILVEEKLRLIEDDNTINDSRCPKKQDIEPKDASIFLLTNSPMSQKAGHREKGTLVTPDVLKTRTSKKQDMNNSNKDNSNNHRLSQSVSQVRRLSSNSINELMQSGEKGKMNVVDDKILSRNGVLELEDRFHYQINYSEFLASRPENKALVDEIIMNMVDMWFSKEVRIKGQAKPQEIIQGVLAKTMGSHVSRVIEKIMTNVSDVTNRAGYLQTMLYMSVLEEQTFLRSSKQVDDKENHKNKKAIMFEPIAKRNNFEQRVYDDEFFHRIERLSIG